VILIAPGGRGEATFGVGATDVLDLCKDAGATWIDALEQKPGDCGGVRRGLGGELAVDGAAVLILPDGAVAVGADLIFAVEEACGGGDEGPLWGCVAGDGRLAGVDLDAAAFEGQDRMLV